jgi:hypothetical protein
MAKKNLNNKGKRSGSLNLNVNSKATPNDSDKSYKTKSLMIAVITLVIVALISVLVIFNSNFAGKAIARGGQLQINDIALTQIGGVALGDQFEFDVVMNVDSQVRMVKFTVNFPDYLEPVGIGRDPIYFSSDNLDVVNELSGNRLDVAGLVNLDVSLESSGKTGTTITLGTLTFRAIAPGSGEVTLGGVEVYNENNVNILANKQDAAAVNVISEGCGNNRLDAGEFCDGPVGESCEDFDLGAGSVSCLNDCSFYDLSQCDIVPAPGEAFGNNLRVPGGQVVDEEVVEEVIPPKVSSNDIDGDNILNLNDNCVAVSNINQVDSDADGVGNACDNCVDVENGFYSSSSMSVGNSRTLTNFNSQERYTVQINELTEVTVILTVNDEQVGPMVIGDEITLRDGSIVKIKSITFNDFFEKYFVSFSYGAQLDSNGNGVGNACEVDRQCSIEDLNGCLTLIDCEVTGGRWNGQTCGVPSISGVSCAQDVGECQTQEGCVAHSGAWDAVLNYCAADLDSDGVENNRDNCPNVANVDQQDSDADGTGNMCDTDNDNDGVTNDLDCAPFERDVYPGNTEVCNNIDDNCNDVVDTDADLSNDRDNCGACYNKCAENSVCTNGLCEVIENDGDRILDAEDNCPLVWNLDQKDTDADGQGDACDLDDDNDKSLDVNDCLPLNPNIYPGRAESCNGIDDNCDNRIDESFDFQKDVNNCGVCSNVCSKGFSCNNGVCLSPDVDNDGIMSVADNCPEISNPKQQDFDKDGLGDVCDNDDDNDKSLDVNDCKPFNPIIYPGRIEACNNVDDNCDTRIDETFYFQTDSKNCGSCGNVCSQGVSCLNGACAIPVAEPVDFIAGDLNNDGCVNFDDVSQIAPNVDLTCVGSKVRNLAGDLDNNGCVNFDDVSQIAPNVDLSCS